jgi:hypothetical protein
MHRVVAVQPQWACVFAVAVVYPTLMNDERQIRQGRIQRGLHR